jgi:hypothetical protein
MFRALGFALTAAATVLVAGCSSASSATDTVSAKTSASAPATETPAPPTGSATPEPSQAKPAKPAGKLAGGSLVLSATGIGPYKIGATLSSLTSAGLVAGVQDIQICPGGKEASATGRYAGKVSLLIVHDKLVRIDAQNPTVYSPSGAHLGMPFATVAGIYGGKGQSKTTAHGSTALQVMDGNAGLVFFKDPTSPAVVTFAAGTKASVEDSITTPEGGCAG